jgi:hypothetical protein
MENSFYYFFSATPQVLGAILALFGVFVLFRVQSLTTELLAICKELEHKLVYYNLKGESAESMIERSEMLPGVVNGILTKNLTYVYSALEKNRLFKSTGFLDIKSRFDSLYLLYRQLVDRTINSTLFTGVIIITCLIIIPFGKWICFRPLLLFSMFFIIVISVIYIFYSFYIILKTALQ